MLFVFDVVNHLPFPLITFPGFTAFTASVFTRFPKASSRGNASRSIRISPFGFGPTFNNRCPPLERVSISILMICVPVLWGSLVGLYCQSVPIVKQASHDPGIGSPGSLCSGVSISPRVTTTSGCNCQAYSFKPSAGASKHKITIYP